MGGPPSPAAPVLSSSRQPPSSAQAAPPASKATAAPPASTSAGGGLFDLDFSSSSSAPAQQPQKLQAKASSKADILSLFASAPPPVPRPLPALDSAFAPNRPSQEQQRQPANDLVSGLDGLSFGQPSRSSAVPQQQPPSKPSNIGFMTNDPWSSAPQAYQQQQPPQPTSSYQHTRAPSIPTSYPTQPAPSSSNFAGLFDSQDAWGSSTATMQDTRPAATATNSSYNAFGDFSSAPSSSHSKQAQSQDVFGDIWS